MCFKAVQNVEIKLVIFLISKWTHDILRLNTVHFVNKHHIRKSDKIMEGISLPELDMNIYRISCVTWGCITNHDETFLLA